jgi:1,6-anhydro-N-acetylmuramate kinase
MPTRHVIGCMTGTSIDALDVALVAVEGTGLGMRARFIRGRSRPLGDLAPRLRRLAEQEPLAAGEIAGLARDFAMLHADVIRELMVEAGAAPARPDLIAVHGQTVFHAPPVSWQLFNPAPLVEAIGAPVVFDLRAADLARGGQGAPITPLADWILFRHPLEIRAVVNLGGFCNLTVLPASPDGADAGAAVGSIVGMDVCACNHLLDGVARRLLQQPYDDGGRAAVSGAVHTEALEDLTGVLASQRRSGRSLGTGDELTEWISRFRAHVSAADLAATACEGLGQTIARKLNESEHPPHRVLLAGGGVHNAALVRALGDWCSAKVQRVDEHGVPAGYREAAEMAVLGALCQDRVPITLPAVTGVRGVRGGERGAGPAPIAGVWTFP